MSLRLEPARPRRHAPTGCQGACSGPGCRRGGVWGVSRDRRLPGTAGRGIAGGYVPRVLVTLLGLWASGCQSTGSGKTGLPGDLRSAKEQAGRRWNAVRSQIKARLAADHLSAGHLREAQAELREALGLDPDNPELRVLEARLHLAEGRIDQAQARLEGARGIGAPRQQAEVEYLLGTIWQQRQRWELALDHFVHAAQKDPDEVTYVAAVVQCLLQMGSADLAREHLETSEARLGWTPEWQVAWAECSEQLGDWCAAAATWRRLAALAESDATLRERLGMALYRCGEYAEAADVLRGCLESTDKADPSDATREADGLRAVLRLALADCLIELRRFGAAGEQLRTVLRADPGNARALLLTARMHAARQDYAGAWQAARRAVELAPDSVAALELAAGLAARAGRPAEARELAQRLIALPGGTGSRVARAILGADPVGAAQLASDARVQVLRPARTGFCPGSQAE